MRRRRRRCGALVQASSSFEEEKHAALLGDAIDGLESFQHRTRTRASRTSSRPCALSGIASPSRRPRSSHASPANRTPAGISRAPCGPPMCASNKGSNQP